jgi:hypothetical protein
MEESGMDVDEFCEWIIAMKEAGVSADIAAQVAGQLFLGVANIKSQSDLADKAGDQAMRIAKAKPAANSPF